MIKKISLILLAFIAVSCNNDDNSELSTLRNINLEFNNLENLGSDYVYEGWLIVNESPVSTGRFSVNDEGVLSQSSFSIEESNVNSATTFVLTIEPATGDDPAPADTHILAADFDGNTAIASVGHAAALNNDFATASGKYILATPTDSDTTNEKSGVWFLDNSSGSAAQGLNLPTLPAGWAYEGWAVINGTPVSTGTFTSTNAADDNAATSPYKGTVSNGPPFPGEDFLMSAPTGLTFPTDLSGNVLVISIEPSPDNSPNPFTLKPLVATVLASPAEHTAYDMTINTSSFPSGTVTR